MSRELHFAIGVCLMAVTTYLIRVIPLLLLRRPIKNRYLRSFFHYVPCVVLAAMAFPAMLHATGNPISGAVCIVACVILALLRLPMVVTAAGGALSVLVTELILLLLG